MGDTQIILVAGTIRVPLENLNRLRPHLQTYIEACRNEAGCVLFSFAEDVGEPGLLRVFEIWRDGPSLERHKTMPHVAAWRAIWPNFGVRDRALQRFEVSDAQVF